MVKSSSFYFPSKDGKTRIRAREWYGDGEPKAVVELIHGIAEHIDRYDAFASFLAEQGYYVVGHDILGHGKSVAGEAEKGSFDVVGGWFTNVADLRFLFELTREKYPDLPYFMLGHSMGSFLLRSYVPSYGEELSGVILSGTGYVPNMALKLGQMMAGMEIKKNGDHAKSETLRKMAFGGYNKKIPNPESENAWLSRDPATYKAYDADPDCGFLPTALTYREMFRGIEFIQSPKSLIRWHKDLPVLLLSGSMDPVGSYGEGVRRVRADLGAAGVYNTKMKLYDGGRHEMLNEINKADVFDDILYWLEEQQGEKEYDDA